MVRKSLAAALQLEGYAVTVEEDGVKAVDVFAGGRFDLVIVDVMLPTIDGFEVCRRIRKMASTPIIVVTARIDTVDAVVGLESGADDYVRKPFDMTELKARIRALLRRRSEPQESVVAETLTAGDIVIDPKAYRVWKRDQEVELSATEFRLLLELVSHKGRVLTRDILIENVWGYDYLGGSRLVDMAIKRLRAKIEDDPAAPRYIHTVRGIGYRLEVPAADDLDAAG
ncbi:MAG: response regulator transcription factor [Actinomycetota bacterium]|nr:response regulator transcription factor [Actinomycetota bacterium]